MIKLRDLVQEGKYDRDVTEISRKIYYRLKKHLRNFDLKYFLKKQNSILLFDIIIKRTGKIDQINKAIVDGSSWVSDAEERIGEIELVIFIHSDAVFKDFAVYLNSELKEAIAHELEHVLQQLQVPGKEKSRKTSPRGNYEYLNSKEEIEAFVVGLYKRAKVEKTPLGKLIDVTIDIYVSAGDIVPDAGELLKKKWKNYAKKRFPKAQL